MMPTQQSTALATSNRLAAMTATAASRPHGDRLRYIAGCRCIACKAANSAYERERIAARAAGDWNGLVSAKKARRHIEKLSEVGVGRRAISLASDAAETVIAAIKAGTKTMIRARTERRILRVTEAMASDHALTDAAPTWKLIHELLAHGFTRGEIALRLGNQRPYLQLSKRLVLVKHAAMVKRIHAELLASDRALIDAGPTWKLIGELADEGYTQKQIARHAGFADGELAIDKHRVARGVARRVAEAYGRLME